MSFSPDEQKLYDAFQKYDLLDPDYGFPFIEYVRNVLANNYEMRKPILDMCNKVKNDYYALIPKASKDQTLLKKVIDGEPIFWGILKAEAQNRQFDSYCLYLEKDRPSKEKFYQPRRRCLRRLGIPQAFQQLIDDELDLLTISLPPGTGKAQPLYSKVLTPDGFVRMADVYDGMEVIAGNGNIAHITGVYPQGKMPIYEITLENGLKCKCSPNHLWTVQYWHIGRCLYKTIELSEIMINPSKWLIPVTMDGSDGIFWLHIASITYTGEEECQCIMIDDPCHLYITDDYIITHNTTLEKFFHSAVAGWYPADYSLFYSHSGDITRMYYDGVYDIVTNVDDYKWHEIFPDLNITSQNAKLEQFNIGSYKPFPTVQCASIGSKLAGKVRASRFLFVDDLIGNIEEALNKAILEKRWNAYTTDARQRMTTSTVDGKMCKELMLMTRWSTIDPIGKLQQLNGDNPRAKFIAVPDIDPKTGKSNFDYDVGGLSVEFFKNIEMLMDEVSYRCLYKQDPIEREGLLYQDDELRRFIDLPNREPDAVLGICDTKEKGIDYMFLPVAYKYDNDYYIVDCICDDNSDFGVQYGRLTDIILRHNVQQVEFESNQGGSRIAFEVQERVKKQGGICNITTKPTETNKETRIIVNSDWVKQNCLFLNKTEYSPKSDYGKMMGFLLGYSVAGKNKHDDVPDGMANFCLFVSRKLNHKPTRIIQSPI